MTAGPLDGVRVLELGSFIAGPFAGQLLGDYGADVIKVESPGDGDPMRRWGVTRDGDSLWWPTIGRNKRSIAVDLRTDAGRAVARQLAEQCDVVLENFRPGTLEKWGLGYAALSEQNPKLVLTHISGYGQTGPLAGQAGFGSVGEAMGGIRYTTGSPDRPPSRAGISLGDALASVFAVMGTLAAVVNARATGKGQEVDVAIYEAVAALMESTMADFELGGVTRTRSGSTLPGVSPSNVYPTSDGAEVVVAANADTVFARLCEAMRQPELADDARFATHAARGENMAQIDAIVGVWTATLPCHEVLSVLDAHGVPGGRIFTAPDMLSDPQYLARDMVRRVVSNQGWDVPMTGVVPRFTRTPGDIRHPGAKLGEHTDEVLKDMLGLDGHDIEKLRNDGVVGVTAYDQVRAAIVENRYQPGERLVEQRIAEELGLSRTPVREALRLLEAEGLVVSERNRGAMVRPLSSTEVVDLYGLRIRLESYAVEVATERATEEELGELVAAADAFSEVRRSVDVDSVEGVRRLHEANRRFHDVIINAARHRRLETMLARTVDIPLVFQAFRTFGAAEIERSDNFHHLIAEAMLRRDAARAAALMAEHIAEGRDAVLDALAVTK